MTRNITPTRPDTTALIAQAWDAVGASFERFCLTAGVATLARMMDEDAMQLCGRRYERSADKAGTAGAEPKGRSASTAARSRSTGLGCVRARVPRWRCRAGRRPWRRTGLASGR
jgi:hypothetical protein